MKAEDSKVAPVVDFRNPDGVRGQTNREITDVLIGSNWIPFVPGSFHYYVTSGDRAKAVPFIRFDVPNWYEDELAGKRVEVFPSTVGGYAYEEEDKDDQ